MPPSNMASEEVNTSQTYDVIVVGAGNAGFTAASTAVETLQSLSSSVTSRSATHKPRVLLLEKAPQSTSGGNTFYTAGAYRFTFSSLSDLRPILSYNGHAGLPDDIAAKVEIRPYTVHDFHADLDRVTSGRADPDLAKVLIEQSRDAVNWMAEKGGMWELAFHRQAYEVDGKFKFWGGLAVCFAGGGKGLVKWHEEYAEKLGVEVQYDTPVVDLLTNDDGEVVGVEVEVGNEVNHNTGSNVNITKAQTRRCQIFSRGGVVLSTGGFQASPDLRAHWLGQHWTPAHVRGSATNTGDMHTLLLSSHLPASQSPSPSHHKTIHAKSHGHFAGCHSVCWDSSSPSTGGNRTLTNQYTKSGYPLGIMVNTIGQRFVDEGLDLRNYTYAKFGREVLSQPNGVAWQIWDVDGAALLRAEEYDPSVTHLMQADSLHELATLLHKSGLENPETFLATVEEFNAACEAFTKQNPDVKFDPAKKDGLSTQSRDKSLPLPKSNWARPLSNPPFTAVKVTCGITFTFGGVKVVPETSEVVADSSLTDAAEHGKERGREENPIKGLYCCGELMGGLFWDNYPGGSGLTAGTVFGRIAGRCVAERAVEKRGGRS